MTYLKFEKSDWERAEELALSDFKKMLGNRPTRKSVSKELPNSYKLDTLNRLAILLLFVIALFTAFKLAVTAIPLSDRMLESNLHSLLPPTVLIVYRFSIIGSAMMVGTFGLIYFKLLAESSSTLRKIEASKRISKLKIEYWSPRLPSLLVYISMLIIILVSNTANVTVFDWVFNNAVVLVELALTYPIGLWMSKRQARAEAITDEVVARQAEYDRRLNGYENDPTYLKMLFQNASEIFFNLRDMKRKRVNAQYRNADTHEVEQIIAKEYRRLKGGVTFTRLVGEWVGEQPTYSKRDKSILFTQPTTTIREISTLSKEEAFSPSPVSSPTSGGSPSDLRKPPAGKGSWDINSLYADLIKMGAPRPINERYLQDNYAAGFNVRGVWREGLREQWNG